MAQNNEQLTSWGTDPAASITSRKPTRRDLPKVAAKVLLGVAAVKTNRADGSDITLRTKK